jgi:outer membrane protein assembly factor BamB
VTSIFPQPGPRGALPTLAGRRQSLFAGWSAALTSSLVLSACQFGPPSAPCQSDRDCRAERICHEGRCRFVEEVRAELAGNAAVAVPGTPVEVPPVASAAEHAEAGTRMFMGDERHTGRTRFAGPSALGSPTRIYQTAARIYASPVLAADGDVLVPSLDQTLTAISPDGQLRFRYAGSGKFYASPAVTRTGDIVAGSADGVLVSLTPSGQLRWQRKLGDGIDTSPLLGENDRIYVAADGIYAFSAEGALEFHYPVGAHVRSAPARHPEGFVVFGTPQGKLVAISEGGNLRFETELGANIDSGVSVTDDGRILVGDDAGKLHCLDAQGRELWAFSTRDDIRATAAVARDGTIIVGSYDRSIYGISPAGSLVFRFETGGRVRSSARIDRDGRIYVGSQDDFLYVLAPNGTLLSRHNLGRDVDASPLIDPHGTLYIGADDGSLSAFRGTP